MDTWLALSFVSALVSSMWSLSVDFGVRSAESTGYAAWYCTGAAAIIAVALAYKGGIPSFGWMETLTGAASGAAIILLTSSFAKTPNPGYSMAAFRTQSVMTAVASYFLFKAPLGWLKLVGMAIVLAGVAILGVTPHKPRPNRVEKNSDSAGNREGVEWLFLALGGGAAMTVKDLLSKKVMITKGPSGFRGLVLGTAVIQACAMLVYSWMRSGHIFPQAMHGSHEADIWGKIALSSMAFAAYQGVITKAVMLAPNPGIVKGIDVLGVILTMLGSYAFLGGTITATGIIGALVVVVGTLLMVLQCARINRKGVENTWCSI